MQKRIKSYLRIIAISLVISVGFVWLSCYFTECPLSQAFVMEETRINIELAIVVNVYLFAICVFSVMMSLLPLPELPGGPWKREQLIVCRYSGLAYSGMALMFIGFGLGMLYGGYLNLVTKHEMEPALIMGLMALMFFVGGGVFILFMKNYMVIFCPGGVVYQNLFKKTYVATNEQIEYVSVLSTHHYRSLRLHTADKDLCLNSYCSEYFEAKEYARRHYADFSDYKEEGVK